MQIRKPLVTVAASLLGASAILIAGMLPFVPAAHAGIVPPCAINQGEKAPQLSCIMETFINVAELIFGISGSAALLMFVIGGFMVLSSAGNEAKVTKGKEYLKNAVIGLFIIFTAAYIIQYGVEKLKGKEQGTLHADQQTCAEFGKKVGKSYKCAKSDAADCMPGFSCGEGFLCCPQ